MKNIVEFKNVDKFYKVGDTTIKANDNLSFTIKEGEFCIIVGPSGSGKTTLLNLLGGMDSLTHGEIIVDGEDISKYNDKKLTLFRRNSIGFVFQFYNLMPSLTAYENVYIASSLVNKHYNVEEVLNLVGLGDRKNNFPSQLSGGEQQRVAIARALVKNPEILLADEPTGALDSKTGAQIISLLYKVAKEQGKTVVIVTHNKAISVIADRIIQVSDGKIVSDQVQENPKKPNEIEW